MPRISRLPILLLLLLLSLGTQAQEEQRDTLQPNRNLFSALAGGIEDVGEGGADVVYTATGWPGHTAFVDPRTKEFAADTLEECGYQLHLSQPL